MLAPAAHGRVGRLPEVVEEQVDRRRGQPGGPLVGGGLEGHARTVEPVIGELGLEQPPQRRIEVGEHRVERDADRRGHSPTVAQPGTAGQGRRAARTGTSRAQAVHTLCRLRGPGLRWRRGRLPPARRQAHPDAGAGLPGRSRSWSSCWPRARPCSRATTTPARSAGSCSAAPTIRRAPTTCSSTRRGYRRSSKSRAARIRNASRELLGQMVDYAANVIAYQDPARLRAMLEARCRDRGSGRAGRAARGPRPRHGARALLGARPGQYERGKAAAHLRGRRHPGRRSGGSSSS